jgi:hypothetical protein
VEQKNPAQHAVVVQNEPGVPQDTSSVAFVGDPYDDARRLEARTKAADILKSIVRVRSEESVQHSPVFISKVLPKCYIQNQATVVGARVMRKLSRSV